MPLKSITGGLALIICIACAAFVLYWSLKRDPEEQHLPEEYRPIGMWGYFLYNILFCIPIVGQILLIVFAVGGTSNRNLKNYARSFFCVLILAVILVLIAAAVSGGFAALLHSKTFR